MYIYINNNTFTIYNCVQNLHGTVSPNIIIYNGD